MYVALGVNMQGHKELLGLWLNETEGAKFWLSCLSDLKNRGLKDIFIACIDGLTGFAEALHAAYPEAKVQLCVVHLVRAALKYVPDKDSDAVIIDLKKIYQAATVVEAEAALEGFAQAWGDKYPTIVKQWRLKWPDIVAMFDFPPAIRKAIYTTNAIESVNSVIRKSRGTAAVSERGVSTEARLPGHPRGIQEVDDADPEVERALNHFAIIFENRLRLRPKLSSQTSFPLALTQKYLQGRQQRFSVLVPIPKVKCRAASCRPSSVLVPGTALRLCRHGALSSVQATGHRKSTRSALTTAPKSRQPT